MVRPESRFATRSARQFRICFEPSGFDQSVPFCEM
jgi:hypothetical protein